MNIDLTRLNSNIDKKVLIDITYSFDKEILGNDIKSLDNVKIKGEITKNSLDDYILKVNIQGTAILPCRITLKDVPYEININIEDSLLNLYELIGKKEEKITNSIDIFPIIWENIFMEIPTFVVSPEAKDIEIEGDGWSYNKTNQEENEFSKLKDLF